jgi:predicted Zn finger-like uncharacterized protein
MIVTCPQCQTRFRIPDERVTAKGVKVRCTRCRHTFRVSRPADQPESVDDPFAQFAPQDSLSEEDKTPTRGISVADALGVVEVEPGAPPADDFDVDVETPEAKRKEAAGWAFPPPPPRGPDAPVPPPPAAEPPEAHTPRVALARIAMVRQLTVVPAQTSRVVKVPPRETRPDDPLELDTGSPHSAWQGSVEAGLELPPASDSAEFDFGDLNLEMTSVPLPPVPAQPPSAPEASSSMDFDEMQSPISPMPVRPSAAASPELSFGELDGPPPPAARSARSLDASDLEFGSAPAPTTPIPTADTKTPTNELFGKSATPLDEESFPLGPSASESRTADRAALFDMPGRPAAEEQAAEAVVPAAPSSLLADVPEAIPDAPVHPASGLPAVPPTTLSRVSRPPTGTSVLGLEEPRELGRARRFSGAVVNIGVAALLVVVLAAVGNVYMNEGRLDWAALSPRRWAALFVPPNGIITRDVTNGLYETRGGRPLAYVRGQVENRGLRPGQVVVRAEIWDGSQLLGKSEGLAGVLPTPEEMVEASTRRDVQALRARLQQGAPAVLPGKATDFVLLFDEPPKAESGLRLKVSAAAVDGR